MDKVADLRTSLEFSQKNIGDQKTHNEMRNTNLQLAVEEIAKLQTLGAKQLEKASYLEKQS